MLSIYISFFKLFCFNQLQHSKSSSASNSSSLIAIYRPLWSPPAASSSLAEHIMIKFADSCWMCVGYEASSVENLAYSSSSSSSWSSSPSWPPSGTMEEMVGFRKATTLSVTLPPHSSLHWMAPAGDLSLEVKFSTCSAVLVKTLYIVALKGGVSGVRCIRSSSWLAVWFLRVKVTHFGICWSVSCPEEPQLSSWISSYSLEMAWIEILHYSMIWSAKSCNSKPETRPSAFNLRFLIELRISYVDRNILRWIWVN